MKQKLCKGLLPLVLLVQLLLPALAVSFDTTAVTLTCQHEYSQAVEVWKIVNKERTALGLSPLTLDFQLTEDAMKRAEEQLVLFSHTRPNGSECFTAFTDACQMAAENIAAGQADAAKVMASWKNSPGHWKNITNPAIRSMGVGAVSYNGVFYWVQLFTDNPGFPLTPTNPTQTVTPTILTAFSYLKPTISPTNGADATLDRTKGENSLSLLVTCPNTGADFFKFSPSPACFSWTSSNTAVATVDENGVVHAVAPGTATIGLQFDGQSAATYAVTVQGSSTQILDPKSESNANPFTDIKPTDWFYHDVLYAHSLGLINGLTATQFAPDGMITCAQAIKLAACMHQYHKYGAVTLKNGSPWYQTYVDYALQNGIIDATYSDYNISLSRAEYTHIFYHALPESSYTPITVWADDLLPDVSMTQAYAGEIYTLYRAGILTGTDAKGTFAGDQLVKRSEVSTILHRMMDAPSRKIVPQR